MRFAKTPALTRLHRVMAIDNDANQAVYGEGVTPRRIFDNGVTNAPNAVVDFRDRLEEYTAR